MRFDTRDTKPKLYDVLIAAAAVFAAIGILFAVKPAHYAPICSIILDCFFLYVLIRLITAFFGQIRYNPYSYNTIIYSGFALFTVAVLVTNVLLTVRLFKYAEIMSDSSILSALLNSAKTYMLISAPFILLFSIALCVSNIALIRHEGKRLVNVLGIILSFLLVAGEVLLFIADYAVSGSAFEVMMHDLGTNLFAAIYLYFECMLIGAITAHLVVYRYEPDKDKDFIIVLGCGIRKDGTPTPLLRGRLDRALEFARRQEELTGKQPIFVTSGGQGKNEIVSESACMKRYLMEKGVPEERIIEEDKSNDTAQNMRFSKEKIAAVDPAGKVAYSTTNYHVFRSGLCARRVKMRAVGMGASTKWYFWPNAAVREFVGLLTEHRGKQAAILISLIVFYIAATILYYR